MTSMESSRGTTEQTALNSSSPASAPTTPSPALAATSFSRSVSSSVSPVASDDLRPRSRSGSVSTTATAALPPAVAFAFDCIHQQYLGYSRPKPQQRNKRRAAPQNRNKKSPEDKQVGEHGYQKDSNEWLEIRLTNSEWLILQDHIISLYQSDLWNFIQDKLRYDYFLANDLLVLRLRRTCMPGRVHESFIRKFDLYIIAQLKRLGTCWRGCDPDIAQLIDEIESWGSLRMQFDGVQPRSPSSGPDLDAGANSEGQKIHGQHEPDCSYSVTRPEDLDYSNEYPGVIIEVATSQKRPRVRALADEYLLGTDSGPAIQAVLALDIDLDHVASEAAAPRKAAKIIEFRRHFEGVEGEEGGIYVVHETEHVFRQPDGERLAGEVRLNLSDFVPFGYDPRLERKPDAQEEDSDRSISLNFDWLNDMLHRAEVEASKASMTGTKRKASMQDGLEQQEQQSEQARKRTWNPGSKRRGVQSEPVERLTDTDEARIRREEEEAIRRAEDDEEDYEPSPYVRDRANANEGEGLSRSSRRSSRRAHAEGSFIA